MADSDVVEAVAMIRAGSEALFAAGLSVSSAQLTASMVEFELQRRRGDSLDQQFVAEAVERGHRR